MAKKNHHALATAMESLHPIIIAQMKYPERVRRVDRERVQKAASKQVTKCERCELRKHQPKGCKPVPFVIPKKKPKFLVVGEAPGPRESQTGRPFVGPAGNLLRTMMTEAGIDPVNDVAWCNTISCFPTVDRKTVRGKPTRGEMESCRDNLMTQVFASYTPYVLLVGATAFGAWRSDLNVTNHHGRFFVWVDSFVTMGIIHPASVLRGSSGYKKLIREDLQRWHDVVYGDDNPLLFLGDTCVKCEGPAVTWDRDGVPWCQKHEKFAKEWEKQRSRWLGPRSVQLEIF